MKNKKIALFYGHVASNIGDLAINAGVVNLLKKACPDATLDVVLLDSEQSKFLNAAKSSFENNGNINFIHFQSFGVKALQYVYEPLSFLKDAGVENADVVLLNSGEHLFQYAKGENEKSLFWRLMPAYAAKSLNKTCIFLPSTFGPFEDAQSVKLIESLIGTIDDVAARDVLSHRLLCERFGVSRASLLLDPAFFLKQCEQHTRKNTSGPTGVTALVMRSEGWGIRLSKEQREIETDKFKKDNYLSSRSFQFALEISKKILFKTKGSIKLFVQTVADQELASALSNELGCLGFKERITISRPLSVQDYLAHLEQVDRVVASRFHALILGMVIGKPVHGVYFNVHGHKIPGLFDLLGTPNNCSNLSVISSTHAAEKIMTNQLHEATTNSIVQERLIALRNETIEWLAKQFQYRPAECAPSRLFEGVKSLGVYAAKLAIQSVETQATRQAIKATEAKHSKDKAVLEIELAKLESERQAQLQVAKATEVKLSKDKAVLEIELAKLESERQAQLQVAKATEAKLSSDKAALEADLAKREAEIKKLADQSRVFVGEKKRLLKETRRAQAQVKSMLAFRLGRVLVENAKRPIRWPLVPAKLFSVWRQHKEDKKYQDKLGAPLGYNTAEKRQPGCQDLIGLYEEKGANAIIEVVKEQTKGGSRKDQAIELLKIAKSFFEQGMEKAEFPLAQAAVEIDRSVAVLRGFSWAAQRANQLEVACAAILEIEELLGSTPSATEKQKLASLKRSPAYQLSLLRMIASPQNRLFEPAPRRICYILHNSLPYSTGGYATRSHGVVGGLFAQNYELIVLTRPGFPADVKPELKPSNINSIDIIDGVKYVRTLKPLSKGKSVPKYVTLSSDELERQFKKYRPEIVIAASNYRVGLMALVAARRLGIPFIYEVRGWWEITRMSRDAAFEDTPAFRVQTMLETAIANHADHVFTLTEPMREELVQRGVKEDKISLLPNSCDAERFNPVEKDEILMARLGIPTNVPVIGYVGTFVDYEGLEDLAEACAILKHNGTDFRLLLVGNENTSGQDRGPITAQIMEAARRGGFEEWLIMPGRVSHEEVPSHYSLIDIAPFPRKPWPVCEMVSPMKPLEALSMEKAVVVSSVRALKEMIKDGETGLIFEKGNIQSLAAVLSRLIESQPLREKLGKTGREWVKKERTWIKTGRKAANTISNIVADPNGQFYNLKSVYSSSGSAGVIEHIKDQTRTQSKKEQAREILKAANFFYKKNMYEVEFPLAKAALKIDRSVSNFCDYAWAAQRANQLEAACTAILEIEEMMRQYSPSEEEKRRIASLKCSPVYQLSLLHMTNPTQKKAIQPVPGRICYVLHNSLTYSSGGYAARSHGVASGLKASGYDVVALTRPGFPLDVKKDLKESVPESELIDGIEYRRILYPLRNDIGIGVYMASIITAFEEEFKKIRPQVVWGASFYISALPALIAAKRLNIPFVYEVRGLAEVTKISRDPKYIDTVDYKVQVRMEMETVKLADHVFTLTEPMREELSKRAGAECKIDLLPNACDPERFFPRKKDEELASKLGLPLRVPVIGYIGTFVDYEGLEDLVSACALLKQQGKDFRLLLVGNENTSGRGRGPVTEKIATISEMEGFSEWLIMPGRIPHNEVENYYSLLDICPFPRKPWPVCEMVSPMKPLEALSMEKAVVVSSVRALKEMIKDGETGLIFKKGNIQSLAAVLGRLIESRPLREKLGQTGREWVKKERNWELIAGKAAKIISVTRKYQGANHTKLDLEPHIDSPPVWWESIPEEFRNKCNYLSIENWKTSEPVINLRKVYVERFGIERVNRRIPDKNWRRTDICNKIVPAALPIIDIGSGLGEFVNLFTTINPTTPIASVDLKDWDLWFDASGKVERIYKSIFDLTAKESRDVVTCFEVLEHLRPNRLEEAVLKLRSLAKRKLFISVPFMEPLPLYKGHFVRFDAVLLQSLFPDARFTVIGKCGLSKEKVLAWIMCEIDTKQGDNGS